MKTKKMSKFNSLGVRVGLLISLILFVILGVKAVYDINKNYNDVIESGEKYKVEETLRYASELEEMFSTTYQMGYDVSSVIQNTINGIPMENRSRDLVINNIVEIMKESDKVSGMAVSFEPNKFDGKDNEKGVFSKYVVKDGGSLNVQDASYEGEDWYTRPMKEKKVVIIDPYVDTDGKMKTTYAFPIMHNNNPVGVVAVDMLIDGLQKMLEEKSLGSDDFKGLLTEEGYFIANAMDSSQIMKNLYEQVPEAKNNVAEALKSGYKITEESIAGSGEKGKIAYIAVNLKGVDDKWCYESVTSLSYFLRDAVQTTWINVTFNVLVILIMGAIVMIILLGKVSKPLSVIESGMMKLSNYDLDVKEEADKLAKYKNSRDEIGSVSRSIHTMVQNLTAIVEKILTNAQSTAATAEELTATAQSASSSSNDVSQAVSNIADGATSQAEDTQNAAASVEASDNLLKDMLEVLNRLTESTDMIDARKNEGSQLLDELIEITDENIRISERVSEVINATNKSTETISTASEMIQSISDQTNLLALNAAIEAARAGEAGKGFAVVAEEIRKLAEDSARFTNEIRQVIEDLKGKSESAVEMMKASNEMMEKQNEKVRETGDKFSEIATEVENSKVIVAQIDEGANKISEENLSVVRVVENLSAIAEENAATTQEAAASVDTQAQSIRDISQASENLADIAMQLQQEISKFNL